MKKLIRVNISTKLIKNKQFFLQKKKYPQYLIKNTKKLTTFIILSFLGKQLIYYF